VHFLLLSEDRGWECICPDHQVQVQMHLFRCSEGARANFVLTIKEQRVGVYLFRSSSASV